MSSLGPGDKPKVVRRRAARVKRKERAKARRDRAFVGAHGSLPQRPSAPKAKPLQAKPPRSYAPASEPKVKIKRGAKPLQANPPRKYSRADEPGIEASSRDQRGAAVRAYDALDGKTKQRVLAQARRNPGTAVNRAILHIHESRTNRNDELVAGRAGRDVQLDSDFGKVEEFKQTRRYQDALADARKARRDYDIEKAGEANERRGKGEGEIGRQVTTASVAPNDFEKVLAPLRKQTKSTALGVLDVISRPSHAIAAAAKEDVKRIQEDGLGDYLLKGGGSKARKAAGKAIAGKDDTSFSDVLDQAGVKNKWVKGIAGFGLDVALDPTTYVTLGVGVPAKVAAKAAEKAVIKAGEKAVKAGAMTRTELERKALQTAKDVYDAHPEHAKRTGLRVGVRGTIAKRTTGSSRALSAPIGSRVTQAGRRVLRAGTTEGSRKRIADIADRAGQQFIHDYRPRSVHPVEHDFIRSSARRYRAAREAADRHAETRARAIHTALKKLYPKNVDESILADAQSTVIHAIEAGIVRNLPDGLRDIAVAVQRDLEKAGQEKLDRGLLGTLDIKGPAPHVPAEVTLADVAEARVAARAAVKAARAAEKSHLESLQGYGVARGRASILSRQVGGTAAEREAEAADAIQAAADVAGGGHGMRQAGEALADSVARVHALRLGAEDAKAKLGLTAKQHQEYQAAAADALEHALKPEGYFPRFMKDEVFDTDHQRFAQPKSGGDRATGTSLKRRQRTQKLAELDDDARNEYDLRLASNVGRHIQETGRATALVDLHDRMAALGRRLDSMDQVDDLLESYPDAGKRLLVREPEGFRQATNKRGEVDMAKLRAALREGHEVVEVPRDAFDHLEALRQRGRNAGELRENVAVRGFDKAQGTIKTAQTAVNPGYHGTNLVGDLFNARLGGAGVRDVLRASRLKWVENGMDRAERTLDPKEFARVRAAHDRKDTYGANGVLSDADVVNLAIETGAVKTGFAGHELPALVKGEDIKTKKSFMDHVRAVSEGREDTIRLATFRAALKRGMTPDEASDWVAKHHFDYGDLTDAERGFARRVIPFYTFMARNTRLQVGALGRSPGTFATYEKARDELAKAADQDPDFAETLQDFEQQGAPVMLPKRLHGNPVVLFPKLPLTDLNNLTSNPATAGQNLLGRMSVLLKTPLEQITGFNTFTRSEYTKDRVPAPSVLKDPALRDTINDAFRQLGIYPAVKDIEDNRTGEMVPGWSWRIDQLLRQIPGTNLAANINTPSRHNRPSDARLAVAGWLAGPRPKELDPNVVSLSQLWEQHDKLESTRDELKQTVKHKSGAKWKGKIADMNEQLGKLEVKIAKTSKRMGVADPPFANRISSGHKRKAAVKAFGASGGGTKMFGAGG